MTDLLYLGITRRLCLLSALLITSFIEQPAFAVDLSSDLVACYPLNGDMNNHCGDSFHGSAYFAWPTMDRAGNSDSAYELDPNIETSGVHIGQLGRYHWGDQFTATIWFKRMHDYQNLRYGMGIIGVGSSYRGPIGIEILPYGENTQVKGIIITGTTEDLRPDWGAWSIVDGFITENQMGWHHAAVTYNGSLVRLYVDGELQGTAPQTGLMVVQDPKYGFSDVLSLGGNGGIPWLGLTSSLKGAVDDARFYNRALTDEEIAAIYNLPPDGAGSPPSVSYRMPASVLNSAGQSKSSLNYQLVDTVGQSTPAGVSVSAAQQQQAGFLAAAAPPGLTTETVQDVVSALEQLLPSLGSQASNVQAAIDSLNASLADLAAYEGGDRARLEQVLNQIQQAMSSLNGISETLAYQRLLTEVVKQSAHAEVDRLADAAPGGSSFIADAQQSLGYGDQELTNGAYSIAANYYKDAVVSAFQAL